MGIAASGLAETLEISRNICHCHQLLLMQHFIWEFQLPKDKRHLSAPRGGEGCRLVCVLHLALHSFPGTAQNRSQQNDQKPPKNKTQTTKARQNLEVALCGARGTNFAAALESHQLKIWAQIWAWASLRKPPWRTGEARWCLLVDGGLSSQEQELSSRVKPSPRGRKEMKGKFSAGEKFNSCEDCCPPAALITARAASPALPSL